MPPAQTMRSRPHSLSQRSSQCFSKTSLLAYSWIHAQKTTAHSRFKQHQTRIRGVGARETLAASKREQTARATKRNHMGTDDKGSHNENDGAHPEPVEIHLSLYNCVLSHPQPSPGPNPNPRQTQDLEACEGSEDFLALAEIGAAGVSCSKSTCYARWQALGTVGPPRDPNATDHTKPKRASNRYFGQCAGVSYISCMQQRRVQR